MASGVSAGPAAGPGAHLRLSEAEKNLVEALAGALGAVCATWVFYPLDTVKTRLQVRDLGAAARCPRPGVVVTHSQHCRCLLVLRRSAWPPLQAAVVGEQSQGDSLASVGRHLVRTRLHAAAAGA